MKHISSCTQTMLNCIMNKGSNIHTVTFCKKIQISYEKFIKKGYTPEIYNKLTTFEILLNSFLPLMNEQKNGFVKNFIYNIHFYNAYCRISHVIYLLKLSIKSEFIY